MLAALFQSCPAQFEVRQAIVLLNRLNLDDSAILDFIDLCTQSSLKY